MSPRSRTWLWCWFCLAALVWPLVAPSSASTILLKDGRTLHGKIGKVAGLAENPLNPKGNDPPTITFLDDDLRRVFIPTFQIGQIIEAEAGEVKEKIGIAQNIAKAGARVNRVGPIVRITPFDKLGHRTFTMMTDKGRLDVIQGITQITPVWTKVEGLVTKNKTPLMWDMRIATSSIPRETLSGILARRIDPKKLEQRLKVVRFYLQAERYQDAQSELEAVIADFPDQQQLAAEVQALRQLHARRIIKEIQVRRTAGQHALALTLLNQFPAKDVAGDILQQVREMLDEYRDLAAKRQQVLNELQSHIATIKDSNTRLQCETLQKELNDELSINTLDRMADYLRLSTDDKLGPEHKISLAFSGWLLGSNHADTNLAVTLSLAKIREVIRKYLNEPIAVERASLFQQLRGLEGAAPSLVAQLIANMKPPLESPTPSVGKPGFYELEIAGIDKEPDVKYYVQLPPGYDPLIRYPTIVTLNGNATTPEQQIDWWAGASDDKGNRLGQATRLGYIVIAVDWLKEGQREYEFSAREHAAVLGSLRDACRRFSIDTDRVFLSGHSLGGNAAWDLGLAHPDLWAGVIPIVAEAEKYCAHYWENARLVPFYVLAGEMDGDKTVKNSRDLDRYMKSRFDITVTEYIGRGHEDFYEDIQNIFDWMGRRKPRNFFPKEFTVYTMRTWDNYFWWFEGRQFPARGMVEPTDWPPPRGTLPIKISGKVLATNGLAIQSGAAKVTVWLSPEVVDFSRPIRITVKGTPIKGGPLIDPDLLVLLEDVRTRGDRQHPFWAKVESQ